MGEFAILFCCLYICCYLFIIFLVGGEVDVVYYLFMQAKTLNDFSNVRISGLLTVCLLMYVYAVWNLSFLVLVISLGAANI